MARKINKTLDKIHLPHWLTILLGLIFILRIPSFFEPFSYGDEMIYLNLGNAIQKGLTLYKDIHDNKPPLLYFLAAIAGNVFWFRVILTTWMLTTTVLFYKLTKKLFPKNTSVQKVSVITFGILTTLPLLEGQIANAELFMIGPIILAFYLNFEKTNQIKAFVGGLLLGIAVLFKVPAIFDLGTIIFIWFILFLNHKKTLSKSIKQTSLLLFGVFTPIALTLIWYYTKAAFPEYLKAAFLQNIGYLSSWRPSDIQEPFLVRNLPLIIRGVVVGVGLVLLTLGRKKLSKTFIFSSAWLLFALFGVTLSERPYPHYLIQIVPAISLLIGFLFANKSREQSLAIIPLFLATLVPVYYKFWYYPTLPYYERFFLFATKQISKEEYFSRFDDKVVRNYQIAKYILSSSGPDEKIFVWGDSSAIYALTKRLPPIKYVANYHISDFSSHEELINSLENNKPSFIVILPEEKLFPELNNFINKYYILIEGVDHAQIWRLLNPTLGKHIKPFVDQ